MDAAGNYIAGEWIASSEAAEDINPSNTGDIVGLFARADATATERAIAAAKAAFPAWSRGSIQQRHDILKRIGDEILARKDELGRLLAREEGKTLAEGVGETVRAGQIFLFFAAECVRLGRREDRVRAPGHRHRGHARAGRRRRAHHAVEFPDRDSRVEDRAGARVRQLRRVQAGRPRAGNRACVVEGHRARRAFRPACSTSSWAAGRSSARRCIRHPGHRRDLVHRIGRSPARSIAAACVAGMKKFQLEMGGKNPLVVLDDADLAVAVECAANGAFFATGQRCTASSRLVVTEGIHDRFVAALTRTDEDARRRRCAQGRHAHRSRRRPEPARPGPALHRASGSEEGARLVARRRRAASATRAGLLRRAGAVHRRAQRHAHRARGDLRSGRRGDSRRRTTTRRSRSPTTRRSGSSAGICTTSLKHATHFKRNAEAGMVMVNLPTAGVDYHVPFGGRKGSSYGAARAGPLCGGVLHDGQDGVHPRVAGRSTGA